MSTTNIHGKFLFDKPEGWRGFSKGSWYPAMRGTLEFPRMRLYMHEPLDGRPEEEIKKVLVSRLTEVLGRYFQRSKTKKKKEEKAGEPPRKPS